MAVDENGYVLGDWSQPAAFRTSRLFGPSIADANVTVDQVSHTSPDGVTRPADITPGEYDLMMRDILQQPWPGGYPVDAAGDYRPLWHQNSNLYPTEFAWNPPTQTQTPYVKEAWKSAQLRVWDFDASDWADDYARGMVNQAWVDNPNAEDIQLEWEGGASPRSSDIRFGTVADRKLYIRQRLDRMDRALSRTDPYAPVSDVSNSIIVYQLDPTLFGLRAGTQNYTYDAREVPEYDRNNPQQTYAGQDVTASEVAQQGFGQEVGRASTPSLVGDLSATEAWINLNDAQFESLAIDMDGPEHGKVLGALFYLLPASVYDSYWPFADRRIIGEASAVIRFEHDFTPPRYRLKIKYPRRLPPLRQFPREDGLGTSSTRRQFAVRSEQYGLRRGPGGYY